MKGLIFTLFAVMIVSLGCVSSPSDASNNQNSSPPLVQQKVETTETGATKTTDTNPIFETITIEDENGTAKVTKNVITKTAEIEYRAYTQKSEDVDLTVFGTLVICGFFQQIIFDPTKFDQWINQWNQAANEWNQSVDGSDTENTNDSNQTTSADSVNQTLGLIGYTVTKLTVLPIDRDTGQQEGACIITGKEENQREIVFYGKYASQYDDYKKMNMTDENSAS